MENKTEYTITKYKIEGTIYSFGDEKEAKEKFVEQSKLLKSDEKLEVSQSDIETTELDWNSLE